MRSSNALASKFPSSPAALTEIITPGSRLGHLLKGVGYLLLGLFALLIPVLGWLCAIVFFLEVLCCLWRAVAPRIVVIVKGRCPHCDTEVQMANVEEAAKACSGCKHRLIYREGRYLDVTT